MIDFITTSTRPLTQQERTVQYQFSKAYHTELNFPPMNVFSQRFNDDFNKEFQQ